MPNTAPFNVVSGSGTIYEAPVGTTFPDVDVDPVAAWVKVGKTGDLDYTRDGITVVSSQTMNKFQSLGSTGTRKIFRASEDLMVMATLADMSPESLSGAFNHNPVDTSVFRAEEHRTVAWLHGHEQGASCPVRLLFRES